MVHKTAFAFSDRKRRAPRISGPQKNQNLQFSSDLNALIWQRKKTILNKIHLPFLIGPPGGGLRPPKGPLLGPLRQTYNFHQILM